MRSSTITPKPPGNACARPAGNGFTTSKIRKRTKAAASTGSVSGRSSTDSVMPATSSMTMAPGSLSPSAASAQVHDAVDLRRLPGSTALPRERGIFARPVDQHLLHGADELALALPRDRVLTLLHEGGALRRELRRDLVGEVRRRRPLLRR